MIKVVLLTNIARKNNYILLFLSSTTVVIISYVISSSLLIFLILVSSEILITLWVRCLNQLDIGGIERSRGRGGILLGCRKMKRHFSHMVGHEIIHIIDHTINMWSQLGLLRFNI
jgi:hypothetical protein